MNSAQNTDTACYCDLLFTTVMELSDEIKLAGQSPTHSVPTLSLVVWAERLKTILNDGEVCA